MQPKTDLCNLSNWVGGAYFQTEIYFAQNLFQTLATSDVGADIAQLSSSAKKLFERLKGELRIC